MILWSTDPLVNIEGQTLADAGAFLETTDAGLDLSFWDGWETGSVSLSEEDARSLQRVLNAVFHETMRMTL
jgi:hypothetical protein